VKTSSGNKYEFPIDEIEVVTGIDGEPMFIFRANEEVKKAIKEAVFCCGDFLVIDTHPLIGRKYYRLYSNYVQNLNGGLAYLFLNNDEVKPLSKDPLRHVHNDWGSMEIPPMFR
jgi:hypothetical protein